MSTIQEIDTKLIHIAATNKSKHYFGKKYTTEEVRSLSEEEKIGLYESFVAIEQSEFASSMKDTFVSGIGELSCALFKIKNKTGVMEDLKNDPFTDKLIGTLTSSLFNKFGYLMAPVSIVSIVTKHKLREKYDDNDDDDDDGNDNDKIIDIVNVNNDNNSNGNDNSNVEIVVNETLNLL